MMFDLIFLILVVNLIYRMGRLGVQGRDHDHYMILASRGRRGFRWNRDNNLIPLGIGLGEDGKGGRMKLNLVDDGV